MHSSSFFRRNRSDLLLALAVSAACSDRGSADMAAVASPGADTDKPGAVAPRVDQRAQRGPEHAVFSLVDNRLTAHLQRDGGLIVPAGSAGFVKYLRFRKHDLSFELRQTRDGRPVARMKGKTGAVLVPLSEAQASAARRIRLRSYNPAARRMTVRVNGKNQPDVELTAGWTTATVAVGAGHLGAGENEILLFLSSGAPMEIDWIEVGGAATTDEAPRWFDAKTGSFVLSRGSGLAHYVLVPTGGRVVADVDGAGCQVAVRAQAQQGAAIEGHLRGVGGTVDLAALAGKPIRLELTADGCPEARLTNLVLAMPGPAPTAAPRGPSPKHIVFWIMDSLRADRLSVFVDGARPEAPTFAKLGETSAVFLQTYVQGNESRASHASIWSSLYPVRHQMITSSAKLAAQWTTLDELAKQAKLFASGVSGNGYIIARWGFGTAWDAYRNHIHDGGGLTAENILAKALASVEGKQDAPWLLYIGTIDTHVSWRAKEPWMGRYDPKPYDGRWKTSASGVDIGKVAQGKLSVSARDIEHIRAIYDSNVSYQDAMLARLLDELAAQGIADDTMIIVTADHGDEQWEHGRVGHGGSLAESLIHVPLLIHYPPLVPAGKISEGAEVIDLLPTLADALGVALDDEWQGESLVPLAQGVGRGYPRLSMASQYEGAHAGRLAGWKLRAPGGAKPDLYHVAEDRNETHNVVDREPIAHRFVADALWLLRAYNAEWKKPRWGNPANVKAAFPAAFGE
jgi:arylsulfatase A-like enzyme